MVFNYNYNNYIYLYNYLNLMFSRWQDMQYKAGGGLNCQRLVWPAGESGNGYYSCPVGTERRKREGREKEERREREGREKGERREREGREGRGVHDRNCFQNSGRTWQPSPCSHSSQMGSGLRASVAARA
jgi:hypothetical protein